MPKLPTKVTVATKVLREEVPNFHRAAKHLGYKNLSSWMEAILRREYNKVMGELLAGKAGEQPCPDQSQATPATAR